MGDFAVTMKLHKRKCKREKVGVDVSQLQEGAQTTLLCIRSIRANGLVSRWNRENPDQRVQCGSIIIACNGARGDSAAILERIVEDEELLLTVCSRKYSRRLTRTYT
uniref:PDZ domain-containing protein n=1 Tax=Alexandrium andersonii TaxID=327968 RepID=A0A7S2ATR5_9DINO